MRAAQPAVLLAAAAAAVATPPAAAFGVSVKEQRFTGLAPGEIVERYGPPFAADTGDTGGSYIRPIHRASTFTYAFDGDKRVAVTVRVDLNGTVKGRRIALEGNGGKVVGAIMATGDTVAFGDRERDFHDTAWQGGRSFNTVTLINEGGFAKLYINGDFFAAQPSPVGAGRIRLQLGPLGLNDRIRRVTVRTGESPAVTQVGGG